MKCTLCESQSEVLFPCETHDVFRCVSCHHAFSANYKVELEEIYSEEYLDEAHKRYFENPDLKMYEEIYNEIFSNFGIDAKIVDIGCGTGSLLKYLKSRGMNNLLGIDLFENEFEGIEFIKADINKIDLARTFDVIMLIGSIEHVFEIDTYFKSVVKIATPNTLSVIYTINEASFFCRLSLFLRKLGINGPSERIYSAHHVNHFSVTSLQQFMKNHNWSIFKSTLLNFPLGATDIGSNWLRPFLIPLLAVANLTSHVLCGPHTQVIYSKLNLKSK